MSYLKVILLILLLFSLPFLVGFDEYYTLLLTFIVIYACIATSWNIIGGMAGQLDFAAATYLGLGAFTSGTLMLRWGIPFWISMPAGAGVASGFAVIIGYPSFRFGLREVWYALGTVASVAILNRGFHEWGAIGGAVERHLPTYEASWIFMRFRSYYFYYYVLVVMLIGLICLTYWIKKSKFGFRLKALSEDEKMAESLGIDVRTEKLKALLIYSFIAGGIGGFYANVLGYIHYSFFDTQFSLIIAMLAIVGGRGIIGGGALAAFLLIGTREVLRVQLGTLGGAPWLIYGVILVFIILFKPEGIGSILKDIPYKLKNHVW